MLKVALVGCGGRGTGAASQILQAHPSVRLWAMADLFADRVETSLDLLQKGVDARYDREAHQAQASVIDVPPERRFVGFDAYRKAIDSGVDVVILATTPHFRPAQFAYAVSRNVHAFIEKPVAIDAPGVRTVLEAAAAAKAKEHQSCRRVSAVSQSRLSRSDRPTEERGRRATEPLADLLQSWSHVEHRTRAGMDRNGIPDAKLAALRLDFR